MKLLFDANLSPKLVGRLAELFPDSVHVFDTGLARLTSDETIWEYAGEHGFTIVTAGGSRYIYPIIVGSGKASHASSAAFVFARSKQGLSPTLVNHLDERSEAD